MGRKNPKFLVEVLRGQPERIYDRALLLLNPASRSTIREQLQESLHVR
jgi:hypothetical protein